MRFLTNGLDKKRKFWYNNSMRIPMTLSDKVAAHDSSLVSQVQDPDGNVSTLYEVHPLGNRKQRRARQQHYPWYTKKMTKGSLWNPRNLDESQAM